MVALDRPESRHVFRDSLQTSQNGGFLPPYYGPQYGGCLNIRPPCKYLCYPPTPDISLTKFYLLLRVGFLSFSLSLVVSNLNFCQIQRPLKER